MKWWQMRKWNIPTWFFPGLPQEGDRFHETYCGMEGKTIYEFFRMCYGMFRGRAKGRVCESVKEDSRWFGAEESIGEQNGGIKGLVMYVWVRGLSSKYICIYGVLTASVSPQSWLKWDCWVLGAPVSSQLESVPCVEVSVCTNKQDCYWPGEWLRGLEPGIEVAINLSGTENRSLPVGWLRDSQV